MLKSELSLNIRNAIELRTKWLENRMMTFAVHDLRYRFRCTMRLYSGVHVKFVHKWKEDESFSLTYALSFTDGASQFIIFQVMCSVHASTWYGFTFTSRRCEQNKKVNIILTDNTLLIQRSICYGWIPIIWKKNCSNNGNRSKLIFRKEKTQFLLNNWNFDFIKFAKYLFNKNFVRIRK